jgi:hypothetical protein
MKKWLLLGICLFTLAAGSFTLIAASVDETSIQLADGNHGNPGGG